MAAERQFKYTPDIHEKIVDLAKLGNYRSTLARAAGVHPDTLHTWLRQGRDHPEKYPDYAQLVDDLEQAEAEWEAKQVEMINNTALSGAPNTWQAGMTMLERKFPERWGRQEKRVIEGGSGTELPQINILVLNDADARREHQDILRSLPSRSTRVAIGPGVPDERDDGQGHGGDVLDVAAS